MADSPTSQLGLAQLGLLQLGMIDSGAAPLPPAPDIATWYIALSQPARPIIEVEGY